LLVKRYFLVGGDDMKNSEWNKLIKKYQIDLNSLVDPNRHQIKNHKAMAKLLTDITKDAKSNHKSVKEDR